MTSRRQFLALSASALFGGPSIGRAQAEPRNAWPGVEVAPGVRHVSLTASECAVQIGPAGSSATKLWGFNQTFPGPELRVRQGERLRVDFRNDLPEPSTIHWHGLRLPNDMDGVPGLTQAPVQPGASFTYEFVCPDAGTFWYHPHFNSSEQLGRGLIGPLIVEERAPPAVDHDLTWILSDLRLDRDGQIHPSFTSRHDQAHAGRIGNVVLINGTTADFFELPSAGRVRLRLIIASNARLFQLQFKGPKVYQMAIDGHPVPPEEIQATDTLGPGQRMDLMFDLNASETLAIQDHAYRASSYALATLRGKPDGLKSLAAPLPAIASLQANPVEKFSGTSLATLRQLPVVITGGAMSRAMKPDALWQINGQVHAMHAESHHGHATPLFTTALGEWVVLAIENPTRWFHPMHLHGVVFQEVLENGRFGPFRDTLLLVPGGAKKIVFRAEIAGKWMIHCHVLEHQSSGLMGYFLVEA
jgi:FtsP/CotA-like multicopper oxidase with cupredoxin domain